MNFFKLYIGDYLRDTGTLTLAQHGAYLLMMLEAYATEKPLPSGRELHRLLRADSKAERDAIDHVAAKFWQACEGGLANQRVLNEWAKAGDVSATNRAIAVEREAKKRARNEHEACTKRGESVARKEHHQTPDTREIPSEANASGAAAPPTPPPTARDLVFANGVPLLTAAGVSEKNARSFLAAQSKAHGDQRLADALQRCATERPIQPVPWLQATLGAAKATKHAGFAGKDYREGVSADGSFV